MIIGVTGGMGSGKSTVLNLLREYYDAYIIPLDDLGKEATKKDTEGYKKVVKEFGEDILDTDGNIDRSKLASIVFSNDLKLEKLNAIVHPLVKEMALQQIRENQEKFIVLESAILFEAGYQEICEKIWFVYAMDVVRVRRLIKSRGYSIERIEQTFARQMDNEEFQRKADVVIDNSGSVQETLSQIRKCLDKEGLHGNSVMA